MATPIKNWFLRLLLSAGCLASSVQAQETLSSVVDLRYGVALYEYYQDHYFEALSELRVAEVRGGIRGHADSPKLSEGGLSLAFGMERTAESVFNSLLTPDKPLDIRSAAWYYLAQLQYRRGDWESAQQSLSKIAGQVDETVMADLAALEINLSIRLDDLLHAENLLAHHTGRLGDQLPYLHYNLGAAHSRAERYSAAVDHYEKLFSVPVFENNPNSEAMLALYDKAYTAAAYSLMLQGEPRQASEYFERVRLESDFSMRALLGYGWAQSKIENHRGALGPWQKLTEQPLLHPPVQEAILAIPFAYEKLGASGQALRSFQQAETQFTEELKRLETLVSQIEKQPLVNILNIIDGTSHKREPSTKAVNFSQQAYWIKLFSSEGFLEDTQALRDLKKLASVVEKWQRKVDDYRFMLEQRGRDRELQITKIKTQQFDQRWQQIEQQQQGLKEEMAAIIENRDYVQLASGETEEYLAIVNSAETALEKLAAAGENTDDRAASLKRFKGVLLWQASETYAEQRWQAEKSFKQLESKLLEAKNNHVRFKTITSGSADIVRYQQRMSDLQLRLDQQKQQLIEAITLSEAQLRAQVLGVLSEQQARLGHYLAQSRLGIARIHDQAWEQQR